MLETGRFRYWRQGEAAGEEPVAPLPVSDGDWFWQQVAACSYELPPGGRYDRDLRWGVAPGASVRDAAGNSRPIHDDRLISAAMVAAADGLVHSGQLRL